MRERMGTIARWWFGRVVAAASALGACACLPDDPRDPPAELVIHAEASEATLAGFVTSDGWTVHYDVFALILGNVGLHETDACVLYSTTFGYGWLHEYTSPGPKKIGLLHGLGSCHVFFDMPSFGSETRVGPDVSDATMADFERFDRLHVRGSAERDGVVKTFDWRIEDPIEFHACLSGYGDGAGPVALSLESGGSPELRLSIRGEGLFESPSQPSMTLFDLVAAADFDGDGEIIFSDALYALPWGNEVVETDLGYIGGPSLVVTVAGGGPCLFR